MIAIITPNIKDNVNSYYNETTNGGGIWVSRRLVCHVTNGVSSRPKQIQRIQRIDFAPPGRQHDER